MKRLITLLIVVAGVYQASAPARSEVRWARPERAAAGFHFDAGAHEAPAASEWQLSPGGAPVGLIVSVARCGDEAFLLDRQLGVVHRADLSAGTIGADATRRGLIQVSGLAADCAGRRLYVVDGSGVGVFDIDTSFEIARFARPSGFVNAVGLPVLNAATGTLAVPGLWQQRSNWRARTIDRLFQGDRIGYRLDVRNGTVTPMMPSVEQGCWSLGPNCLYATLDRVEEGSSPLWLAAHRVGMSVGVYDADYRLVRSIDVRSPMFRESGERNERPVLEDMIAWNEDNSVIRQVHAFGDRVVTIHSYNRTRGWKPRQQTDFEVFMNVHTLSGEGVTSDARLRDLPVGRDAEALYVVDYGHEGRRATGTAPIWLIRVPVTQ